MSSFVLAELEDYGVKTPSDSQVAGFKKNVYEKYLQTLSEHITNRFPDVDLLEGCRSLGSVLSL